MLSAIPAIGHRIFSIKLITAVDVRGLSHIGALLIGFLLVFLGGQLRKRKHRAWQGAVGLFSFVTVLHVIKGPDLPEAIVTAVLLVTLLLTRRCFPAAGDPPSIAQFFRFVPLYAGIVLSYGIVAIWVERNAITPPPTLEGMVRTVLNGLVGADGPYAYAHAFFRRFFPFSLLALGILGLVVALVLLFRPLVQRPTHSPKGVARARDIVRRYGSDTLAYFALRPEKTIFFSSDGRAMIAYGYMGGYALASGDPIGAPESIPLVLDEFLHMCDERAWGVAVLAAREADAPMYEARGLTPYYLGDEAIIDCRRFSLEGRPIRKVRQSVNRMEKYGYTFELISDTDASETLRGHLDRLSALARGKAPERGFTMALGTASATDDPDCLLAIARDSENVPRGFLHLVPCYGEWPGYSLDLMRHDPETPNGLTEYLVCLAALALKERGAHRLSLNFAAFARILEDDARLGPWQKLQKMILKRVNPYFQIESLYDFNRKFFPDWVPRSIYYDELRNLPRIAILYLEAEAFLRVPFLGRTLVPVPGDKAPLEDAAEVPAG